MTATPPNPPPAADSVAQPTAPQLLAPAPPAETVAWTETEQPHEPALVGLPQPPTEVLPPECDLLPPEPGEEKVTGALRGNTKRTRWQREADLMEITEMMHMRFGGYREIAAELNRRLIARGLNYTLSAEQIRLDLKEVRRRHAEIYMGGTIRQHIAAELAMLERIEREAWQVYQRSLRDENRGSQTTRQAQMVEGNGRVPSIGEITKMAAKAQRDGDVSALLLLVKTGERRAALLGLESVKVQVFDGDAGEAKARMEKMGAAYKAKIERDVLRKLAALQVPPVAVAAAKAA